MSNNMLIGFWLNVVIEINDLLMQPKLENDQLVKSSKSMQFFKSYEQYIPS